MDFYNAADDPEYKAKAGEVGRDIEQIRKELKKNRPGILEKYDLEQVMLKEQQDIVVCELYDIYSGYIEKCREKAFTLECSTTGDSSASVCSYSADNKDGYHLSIDYYPDKERISVMLNKPAT